MRKALVRRTGEENQLLPHPASIAAAMAAARYVRRTRAGTSRSRLARLASRRQPAPGGNHGQRQQEEPQARAPSWAPWRSHCLACAAAAKAAPVLPTERRSGGRSLAPLSMTEQPDKEDRQLRERKTAHCCSARRNAHPRCRWTTQQRKRQPQLLEDALAPPGSGATVRSKGASGGSDRSHRDLTSSCSARVS